ncbi:MAG TPA: hydrogenase formation protein HypD [Gaiellaceae bacterium]
MRYVDEYRDGRLARKLAAEIAELAAEPVRIMEVCGGHTHAIARHGLEDLLPPEVEYLHGPGCPVCVIPMGRVDDAIALAAQPGVTLATFGDLLRVPGRRGSLLEAKAAGADVRMVYSPLDALELARLEPAREVVFFAIGFETTAPATAITLLRAREAGVRNFSVFCNHVTIVPPLRAILDTPGTRIDAFIAPGHVSTVIGTEPYRFIPEQYGKQVVVAAFEPLDLLASTAMILRQRAEGRCEVENQYTRVVRPEGNPRALAAIAETMELRDTFEWRGLGFIRESALRLRPELAEWDAEERFELPGERVPDRKACQCGQILVGAIKPHECKVFGTACTPERPLGTCMVSSEGACAAYYAYGRHAA